MDIYGQYKDSLEAVMRMMAASIEWYAKHIRMIRGS